jgi:hypothetical protein
MATAIPREQIVDVMHGHESNMKSVFGNRLGQGSVQNELHRQPLGFHIHNQLRNTRHGRQATLRSFRVALAGFRFDHGRNKKFKPMAMVAPPPLHNLFLLRNAFRRLPLRERRQSGQSALSATVTNVVSLNCVSLFGLTCVSSSNQGGW